MKWLLVWEPFLIEGRVRLLVDLILYCQCKKAALHNREEMEQYEKMYLYRRIVQAKLFIDSHFADDIDINSIAGQAHFSKFHFIRLFKSIYGKTPHNYLIKVRIDNARLLLSNGTSVIETSIMTGFDSPTSFTAVFKKTVGKTPSEFRTSVEQKKEVIVLNPLNVVPNCFIETFGLAK